MQSGDVRAACAAANSNMVRAGAMSRQEALERIPTEGEISEQRLKEVLDEKFWL